ncbi:helicase-related protein [Geodermatophilus normandii]|uniref:Helicase n=1 Tax=Geodermatophilus normandii TaxID=1137989 RepID=A0A6P0GBU4_9ACTN|nr:helicase-related protein [Geodermatophilus normandii]NEM05460.1 helicase [Geodermatophilus normandii]
MTTLADQYGFREDLVETLCRDLLGPTAPDEVLDESPLDRYVTGVLFPMAAAGTDEERDEPDAETGARTDAGYDPGVALSRQRHPSSMGLSFAVDLSVASEVILTSTAARYAAEAPVDARQEPEAHSRSRRPRGNEAWRRVAVGPVTTTLDVTRPGIEQVPVADGLELYCVVRPEQGGAVPVTAVLRNTFTVARGELRDGYCFLQPSLEVSGEEGAFVDRRSGRQVAVDDDDLESYDLLFRDVRTFAVGHGCAVEWETGRPTVSRLATTFLPSHELLLATPRELPDVDLRMSHLAEAQDDVVLGGLRRLVEEYRRWIAEQRAEGDRLPPPLRNTAARHMDDAEEAARRILSGIDLLAERRDAMLAFRLMNRAMQVQRARQDWIRAGARGEPPNGTGQTWRPFQIAFVLLALRGIVDPEHEDRERADLLWFPTGGGKTEAYLGLIAFAILMRRLTAPTAGGVSVLMRYTLRLLTLQQFERAASLICSLEVLRRTTSHLPDAAPISLGLWVGQSATPNSVDKARAALNKIRGGQKLATENPVQLTRCPWCGIDLDVDDYTIDRRVPELRVACRNGDCAFAGGLPVHLVDDDVYRVRPSLLIGTVDKFAMLAWQERAGTIFSTDGRGLPPDLIVQDELHLISGPLGTLVGLYEAAVDTACALRHRPKVIASTATIRRAKAQVRAVFDRTSAQFPPPGLTVGDTFFSEDADREDKGTRRYVGIMAPGTSQTTLMIRTYAALLQGAQDRPAADEIKDPYWTLVGYFNSLRVLGGAYMQVLDDVPDRLKVLAQRTGSEPRRITQEPMELTSRTDSSDIPIHLTRLGRGRPDPDTPDVVLATNMISVGVDVDRLGLMTVMGQPQATAEYIQASSRVGRKHPGLVVVMYNGARSRDRSHYEDFLPYHQTLYRQVEATSATPFAARARDRGLHGVLVAMARLLAPGAGPDTGAGQVDRFVRELEALAAKIVERARDVDPDAASDTDTQLQRLIDVWVREADARRPLRYSVYGNRETSLLVQADQAVTDTRLNLDTDDVPWPTLTSLRDVDATSSLHLVPNRDRKAR